MSFFSFALPRRLAGVTLLAGAALLWPLPAAAGEPLSLGDVLTRAARVDIAAADRSARIEAAQASVQQAGVGPQPTLGVDLEDIAGTGPYSPVNQSQTTFYYERAFERGGKREARIGAAQADVAVTREQARIHALDWLATVQTAWVEAQAAQAMALVADEQTAIADRLQRDVARRVARALDPLFAGERARAEAAEAAIARDRARAQATLARHQLAALLRQEDIELDPAIFGVLKPMAAPDAAPDIDALEAAEKAADRRVELERARTVTDPTLRAGVRYFTAGGSNLSVVFGGAIPLGGRKANLGNVHRAEAERLAAEAQIAVARVHRQQEIAQLTARRDAIERQLAATDAEVMPRVTRAVALVRDGFNRGGLAFTFSEVAAAQRAVVAARLQRIELLKTYHLDGARLDRLTGRHLPLLPAQEAR